MPFTLRESDKAFLDRMSPVVGGEKYHLPMPESCPACRQRHRYGFRHHRKLYKRKCDLTGRDIISIFSEGSPHKVFYKDDWYSDKWDPMTYGKEISWDRPFFDQFKELFLEVPQISLYQFNNQNCEFVNASNDCKDLYLCFHVVFTEQSMYCDVASHVFRTLDCAFVNDSELCYWSTDLRKCYQIFFSEDCYGCAESAFLRDCRNVKNSLGCTGLSNAEYCVLNRKVSREEFKDIWERVFTGKRSDLEAFKRAFQDLCSKMPRPHVQEEFTEEISGNHLVQSKGAYQCFDSDGVENCSYCSFLSGGARDCMDYDSYGENAELQYEVLAAGMNVYNNLFGMYLWQGTKNTMYSTIITGGSDLFGCVGLSHKQYCILNKQYNKEEYEGIVGKLIAHMQTTGEWGRFFPASLSPFAYNISLAQDFYPLCKEDTEKLGFKWSDETDVTRGGTVPEDVFPIDKEETLAKTYVCQESGVSYKIAPQEYSFLQYYKLPLPNLAPSYRQRKRMQHRAGRTLVSRECMNPNKSKNCLHTVQTVYKDGMIYCKPCYLQGAYLLS